MHILSVAQLMGPIYEKSRQTYRLDRIFAQFSRVETNKLEKKKNFKIISFDIQ